MADMDFMRYVDELQGQIDKLKKMIKGAGGGSTVTITPTLDDGVKVADFTIGEDSGSIYAPLNLVYYSSTEQVVGEWTDGSPLYRKVIAVDSLAADTNADITSLLPDVDKCFVTHIMVTDKTTNIGDTVSPSCAYSTYNIAGPGSVAAYISKDISENKMLLVNPNRVNSIDVIAVVEYTKTTDTVPNTRTTKKKK